MQQFNNILAVTLLLSYLYWLEQRFLIPSFFNRWKSRTGTEVNI